MVRVKHRYLLVEFVFSAQLPFDIPHAQPAPALTEGLLVAILRESLSQNFGDIGWSRAGSSLNIKYLSPTTRLGIVRCHRGVEKTIRAALTFIRSIKGAEVCCRVWHVGGTIRKTQQECIRHDRKLILASLKSTAAASEAIAQSEEALKALYA